MDERRSETYMDRLTVARTKKYKFNLRRTQVCLPIDRLQIRSDLTIDLQLTKIGINRDQSDLYGNVYL